MQVSPVVGVGDSAKAQEDGKDMTESQKDNKQDEGEGDDKES